MPDPHEDYRVANARAGLALYIPGKTPEQTMNDLRKAARTDALRHIPHRSPANSTVGHTAPFKWYSMKPPSAGCAARLTTTPVPVDISSV